MGKTFNDIFNTSGPMTDAQYISARDAGFSASFLADKGYGWLQTAAAWVFPKEECPMTAVQFIALVHYNVTLTRKEAMTLTFLKARDALNKLNFEAEDDERYDAAMKSRFRAANERKKNNVNPFG